MNATTLLDAVKHTDTRAAVKFLTSRLHLGIHYGDCDEVDQVGDSGTTEKMMLH